MARWEAERPDLVLMDLQMPELDGYGATGDIHRREQEQQPVPIIAMTGHASEAMTGHASEEEWQYCLDAGMTDCLFKLFRVEDLEEVVGRNLTPESPVVSSRSAAESTGTGSPPE